METKSHWDGMYRSKLPNELSWFQREARISLELITRAGRTSDTVIDVGGGASPVVDGLLARGYTNVTVLDIASDALEISRTRLGELGNKVEWVADDVLSYAFRPHSFDVWHDRALFHFLTDAADRRAYADQMAHAVRSGGMVVVATFADDGPQKCSGLDVCRYSPEALQTELGTRFRLKTSALEDHVTPTGTVQRFQYSVLAATSRPHATTE